MTIHYAIHAGDLSPINWAYGNWILRSYQMRLMSVIASMCRHLIRTRMSRVPQSNAKATSVDKILILAILVFGAIHVTAITETVFGTNYVVGIRILKIKIESSKSY